MSLTSSELATFYTTCAVDVGVGNGYGIIIFVTTMEGKGLVGGLRGHILWKM